MVIAALQKRPSDSSYQRWVLMRQRMRHITELEIEMIDVVCTSLCNHIFLLQYSNLFAAMIPQQSRNVMLSIILGFLVW